MFVIKQTPIVPIIPRLITVAINPLRVPKSTEVRMLKIASIKIPLAAKPKENNPLTPKKKQYTD